MDKSLPPYVVCSKCGRGAERDAAFREGWLIAWSTNGSGRIVMRCPKHQTSHARQLAGLPCRVSTKRIERLLPEGLSFYGADGRRWSAFSFTLESGHVIYSLQVLWGTGIPESLVDEFLDLPALVLAMSQVADLRRWFRTGTRLLPGE